MLHADHLYGSQRKISTGEWVVARPEIAPLITRIKDAWNVLLGNLDAVKFKEQ